MTARSPLLGDERLLPVHGIHRHRLDLVGIQDVGDDVQRLHKQVAIVFHGRVRRDRRPQRRNGVLLARLNAPVPFETLRFAIAAPRPDPQRMLDDAHRPDELLLNCDAEAQLALVIGR